MVYDALFVSSLSVGGSIPRAAFGAVRTTLFLITRSLSF
jgi:hypothetical protein